MRLLVEELGFAPVALGLLACAAAALLTRGLVQNAILQHFLSQPRVALYRKQLRRDLLFIRVQWSADQVIALQVLAASSGLLLPLFGWSWGALGLVVAILPNLLLTRLRQQRVVALEGQVESWIGSLARALEAAPSLGEALASTVMSSASPMREEVELLVNELELGSSLSRALLAWEERVQSRVLSMALSTLQIGRQTGGSLPEVLKDAAATLREMERLEGVIRTKTAEGKAQSFVVGVLPLAIYPVMNWVDPTHFDPLKNSAIGHLLVALAVVLWLAALFAVKKILAVRI